MDKCEPSFEKAKVLVVGSSSFIGVNLVPALKKHNAVVIGTYFSTVAPACLENVEYRYLDVTDFEAVKEIIDDTQPDYIFNLSGYVQGKRGIEYVWPTFKTNLEGTINLLMALQGTSCKCMINLGSLEEHQLDASAIQPVSPYAASKIAANAYVRMFHALYKTPLIVVRPFMVYGPKQKDHTKLVPYTILSILKGKLPEFSSGLRKADWLYVEDAVAGLITIALTAGLEGQTLQMGTGELTSVQEIVETIFDLLGVKTKPKFGLRTDRKSEVEIAANTQKAQELVGWKSTTPFREGLKKTIAWYQEQLNS